MTHTPGPWDNGIYHATTRGGRTYAHVTAGGMVPVAVVQLGVEGFGREEGEANAKLIGAAPDMLAGLKAVRARFQDYRLDPDASAVLDRIHEAIANAEGR